MIAANNNQGGFSLIEVALALFIMTLLIGSLLVPLGTQVEQRQISATQKTLEEIKEALVGFALANGYLPCPDKSAGNPTGLNDTANDGVEDFTGGECRATDATGSTVNNFEGNIPWNTLGVADADVWGNRFRYRITAVFAQRPPASNFTLSSTGTITVSCPAPSCNPSYNYTTSAPALILSHGKNGLGAISARTGNSNPLPTSANELENTNGNATFISRTFSTTGSNAGEFDDIVTWLSSHILFNRMVSAGKLPQ